MVVIDVVAFELGNAKMKHEIPTTILVVYNRVKLRKTSNEKRKQNQNKWIVDSQFNVVFNDNNNKNNEDDDDDDDDNGNSNNESRTSGDGDDDDDDDERK